MLTPVLIAVRARGLLGQFDHEIRFPESQEFVIIYGPNGVGKTKLLEAAHALTALAIRKLSRIPFSELELEFADSTKLVAIAGSTDDNQTPSDGLILSQKARNLQIRLLKNGKVVSEATSLSTDQDFEDFLATSTTWEPIGADVWEDTTDGEVLTFDELQIRYSRQPRRVRQNKEQPKSIIPEQISEFASSLRIHLIETQRLLTRIDPPVPSSRARMTHRRARSATSTVSAYSEDLKRRLGVALAQNSRTTQQLDRTFPKRVLEDFTTDVDDEQIRVKYHEQSMLRDRLAEISVVGGEADLPLPRRSLEDWERHVLWTSLIDTDEKLSSFEEMLNKISLLKDIVNNRFFGKHIQVNAEDGLIIRSDSNDGPLSPELLSSGEQHELVLIYDLLFNAQPGSVVFIDEPEISLHISWQKQFLTDIMRIAHLSSLRFIVATHSPQIINKWWDQTIELGPGLAE